MTFSINEDSLRNLVYLQSHHDGGTKHKGQEEETRVIVPGLGVLGWLT